MQLAVDGPASESVLRPVTERELRDRMGDVSFRWAGPDGEIRLSGTTFIGYDFWKSLVVAVMACMLVEMFLLRPLGEAIMTGWLGRLFGADDLESVEDVAI